MKFINLVFASIYDWYNRMKSNGRNIDPLGMAALMFGLSIEGWSLLLFYLFFKYFRQNESIPSSIVLILFALAIIFSWLVNEYYTSKERYLQIYNDYISLSSKGSKQKNVLFSFCFLLLPYLILLVIFIF